MSNSRLPRSIMVHTSSVIAEDNWCTVEVWRGDAGAEVRLATVRTRIAPTSRAVAGRDLSSVQGGVSPQYNVMVVPAHIPVQSGDDVWRARDRFRVVSVDRVPHGLQVIMQVLQ